MRVQKVKKKKKTKLKSKKKNNSSGNTAAWYRDLGVIQSLAKHNKEGGSVYLVFSNIKVVNLMDDWSPPLHQRLKIDTHRSCVG